MANSKLLTVSLLLVAASLGTYLLCSTGTNDGDRWGSIPWGASSSITTLPFSPLDVLPLLPRRVAMAALRALRGASDIFPVFVGTASAGSGAAGSARAGWKGACFYENEAWLVFHNESGSKYGGGTLHLKVRCFPKPQVWFWHKRREREITTCCYRNDQLLPPCSFQVASVEKITN